MLKKFAVSFKNLFPVAIITAVWAAISWANFTPGTWLTGWDNLHPEFNFPLNIGRALSAVWQEYQGLGLLGGMAHAADLPRQLVLAGLAAFVPAHLIRYLWTFAMLLLGPLGVYFFTRFITIDISKGWSFKGEVAGLVAGLFYLLNLATVQTFFTPYEAFVAFYGFLPWFIFLGVNYLNRGSRKSLLLFMIVSLIGTAAFYVQTLFVVYLVILSVIALEIALRRGREGIKRLFTIYFLLFAINSFWLLPAAYFSFTRGSEVALAHQNQIASPETRYFNEARGDFLSIASLKGYWFDYYDLGKDGKFDYLYSSWLNYLNNPALTVIGVGLFILAALGLAASKRPSWLILLVITYMMLATSNPPFGGLYKFAESNVPLFAEVFRNAFTKWANAAAFVYSLGLGYCVASILGIILPKRPNFLVPQVLRSLDLKNYLALGLGLVLAISMITVVFPVFSGNLISKTMRVNIPNDYFELFGYLDKEPADGRIALLPANTFWGWDFFDWGYRGSGFLWYGVKQPILSRTFDVWSRANEAFYDELSYTIDTKSSVGLSNVLAKYQVSYLVIDNSLLDTGGTAKKVDTQEVKKLIKSIPEITGEEKFGEIEIYKTNLVSTDNFISAPETIFPNGDPGEMPALGEANVRESFTGIQGFPDGHNCELKGKGTAAKERLAGGNLYRAEGGGVECDYFYYPGVKANEANVLRIKGENLAGRGLKIYLQDASSGKIFRQELLPEGKFDQYFLLLPRNDAEDKGYIVNVETRAFGKIASENIIEAIEFSPFKGASFKDVYSIQNSLKINSVKKFGTWLYKIDTEESGLIMLGQGYDEGWVAFEFKIPNSKFKILEHTKLNGWANGWLVPANEPINQSTIFLVYWPQLLEFLGFVLLAGAGIAVLTIKANRRYN